MRLRFHLWPLAAWTICVVSPAFAANLHQGSQCDAPGIVTRLENEDAIFELASPMNKEALPYRDEAVEIFAKWFGREPIADGRIKVDESRMAKARELFTQCARAGLPGALLLEGAMLSTRIESAAAMKQAKESFERAATGGISIAHFGVAMIDYRMGEAAEAEKELTKLLAKNKRFTPETLGMMLRAGNVLPKSGRNAQPWLVMAATQDDSAAAQRALYEMYSSGEGVPRSEAEAEKWLAMLKDNPDGQRDWEAEQEIMKNARRNN